MFLDLKGVMAKDNILDLISDLSDDGQSQMGGLEELPEAQKTAHSPMLSETARHALHGKQDAALTKLHDM
jgi:hypothetical protein